MVFLQLLFLLFYDSDVCEGGGTKEAPLAAAIPVSSLYCNAAAAVTVMVTAVSGGTVSGLGVATSMWPFASTAAWCGGRNAFACCFFFAKFSKNVHFCTFFRHAVCSFLLITSNFFHPRWCYRAIVDVTYTSPLRMALQFADLLYWKDVAEPVWDSYFGTSQSQKPCRSGRDRTVSAPPPFA